MFPKSKMHTEICGSIFPGYDLQVCHPRCRLSFSQLLVFFIEVDERQVAAQPDALRSGSGWIPSKRQKSTSEAGGWKTRLGTPLRSKAFVTGAEGSLLVAVNKALRNLSKAVLP